MRKTKRNSERKVRKYKETENLENNRKKKTRNVYEQLKSFYESPSTALLTNFKHQQKHQTADVKKNVSSSMSLK